MKGKALITIGAAVVMVSLFLSLGAAPPSPAPSGKPEQPQAGHARPPIYYQQVGAPLRPDKPGKGPGGSGATTIVYTPANIQSAYDFGAFADGSKQVIAIIDAYGDPTIDSDVAAFNTRFGTTSSTINLYYPDGQPTSTSSGWAVETALDVEWAQANAPNATIDVIIVPDSSFQSLLDGIKYAISLKVTAISMSFGAPEINVSSATREAYESAFDEAYSGGVLLFGASGDQGAYDGTHPKRLTADFPASSPRVIGVGGTTLTLNGSGGWGSESAWSGSGGGYSAYFGEPVYQSTAGISDPTGTRGVPDVAFDADPNTGVYVYCGGKWYSVGGTSVGAPNWAAIAADDLSTSNNMPLTLTNLYGKAYGNSNEIHDITGGSNGYYSATAGWDAVTGIGTPNVSNLITGK